MSWYNENNNWYTPNYETPRTVQPEAAPVPEKQRRNRIIAVIATVCVLIAAIVVISQMPARMPADTTPTYDFSAGLMPPDWHDYLDHVYAAPASSKAQIGIPRVAAREDLGIELLSGSGDSLSFNAIYDKCTPSIVGIKNFVDGSKNAYGWGTGIIISADGYILTNTHVVDKAVRVTVEFNDGGSYEASLVGADTDTDIAVLKIDADGLTPAEFATSSSIRVGDTAVAIGNPLGENFRMTMTNGIISAISREVSHNGKTMNLIQTNAAINEGNSGGPLINSRGQVIGVTNMKMVSTYTANIEGIGFAIPSDTVKAIVDALISDGAVYGRATIGVTVGAVVKDIADYYDIPDGLYVSRVEENSDAAKQGIKVGDIIVEANGTKVHSTADLSDQKKDLSVGDSLSLTVWRNSKTFNVDVKLMDATDIYK